jgi:predicted flap endonuclease-1-like 5' DNA nuclease
VSGRQPEPPTALHDDNLTRIAGLGQDIARRLDKAGTRTYAEPADCSVGEIANVLPGGSPLLWQCIDG